MLSGPHRLTRSSSSATHCVIEPTVAMPTVLPFKSSSEWIGES